MRKLTNKQKLFVKEYLIDLNATQAAIRAGYSVRSASFIGMELLNKTIVADAIQKAMNKRTERTQINADYVLNRLVEIDQLDIADILSDDGKVLPIKEWPQIWRQSISGVDIQELLSNEGDLAASIVKKIKWPDNRVNTINPAIMDRINAVNAKILNGEGIRYLKVNTNNCPELTESLEQQPYDKNGMPDKSGGLDHILDAAGYFIAYQYPIVKRQFTTQTIPGFGY